MSKDDTMKHLFTKYVDVKKERDELKLLIAEATDRLSLPIKLIRRDGFSELMGKLREVNE